MVQKSFTFRNKNKNGSLGQIAEGHEHEPGFRHFCAPKNALCIIPNPSKKNSTFFGENENFSEVFLKIFRLNQKKVEFFFVIRHDNLYTNR